MQPVVRCDWKKDQAMGLKCTSNETLEWIFWPENGNGVNSESGTSEIIIVTKKFFRNLHDYTPILAIKLLQQ